MNSQEKQGEIDWDKVLSRSAIAYLAIEATGIAYDFQTRQLNDGLSDPDFFTLSLASNAVFTGLSVLGTTCAMFAADYLAKKNKPIMAGLTFLVGTTASVYGGSVLKSQVDSLIPKMMHHKQNVSTLHHLFEENTDVIPLPENTISFAAAKAHYALT